MKADIMRLSNLLCDALSACDDGYFVDRVCAAVSCCIYFSDKEIEAAEAEAE